MHTKFGVNPAVRQMDADKLKAFLEFRIRFLQEELDEMMAEINQLIESGEFFEKARPLSEETLANMGDEELEQLANAMGFVENEENPRRKLH